MVRDQKVAGSNPVTSIKMHEIRSVFRAFFVHFIVFEA